MPHFWRQISAWSPGKGAEQVVIVQLFDDLSAEN
jgi:hypothetical protein